MNQPHGAPSGAQLVRTALWGTIATGLYFLLYLFEDWIVDIIGRGGWYFIVPLGTAFLFSFVHGSFTAHFWDVLGVKAKK